MIQIRNVISIILEGETRCANFLYTVSVSAGFKPKMLQVLAEDYIIAIFDSKDEAAVEAWAKSEAHSNGYDAYWHLKLEENPFKGEDGLEDAWAMGWREREHINKPFP